MRLVQLPKLFISNLVSDVKTKKLCWLRLGRPPTAASQLIETHFRDFFLLQLSEFYSTMSWEVG
jgi:hypothetical protein